MLELGCGNGRDALFFLANGIQVTGIDASDVAINKLNSLGLVDAKFFCGNFVDSEEIYSRKYDVCYSRFSLHAVNEIQEDLLLKNIFHTLNDEGKFFVEVRGIHDELFGRGEQVGRNCFLYNGHFRRFVDKAELEKKLLRENFKLEYSEESTDFAPLGNNRPPVIRIFAKKNKMRKFT